MSRIQTYFLREESCEVREAIFTLKVASMCNGSPKWPHHRAEVPVPLEVDFDHFRTLLPVKCMYCGKFEFTRENAQVCGSTNYIRYTNPVTGRSSVHLHHVEAPGSMWFAPWLIEDGPVDSLGPEYRRDWLGKRAPIVICLPNGSHWCLDQRSWLDGVQQKNGWTITGDNADLSASPSIHVVGKYHGWLKKGWLEEC